MGNFLKTTGRLEEEQTIQEEFVLTSEDDGQVPRTITRDGKEYRLDEDSLRIQVSKTELWREQQVMDEYISYAVEDNDIDRLQKEITKDGKVLELIGVEYSITETTESGLPMAYEARCHYAVQVENDQEIPVEWKAAADYVSMEQVSEPDRMALRSTEESLEPEAESEVESETGPGPETEPETKLEMESEQKEEPGAETEPEEEEELETISMEEDMVPLAASLGKPALPLGAVAAGFTGTLLMGTFFLLFLFRRKQSQVLVYSGSDKGKDKVFLGKTYARQERGVLVIPIPEKLAGSMAGTVQKFILRPSKRLLKGKVRQAKIVSARGLWFTKLEESMVFQWT